MINRDSYPWHEFKDDIKQIVIEDGIKTIGWHAFEDCISLSSIEIPESTTYIGMGAFNGCNSLKNVYFGETDLKAWADIYVY